MYLCFFFFNDTATTEIYTLSLHDALPIWGLFAVGMGIHLFATKEAWDDMADRYWDYKRYDQAFAHARDQDRKSTRLNSSHANISYAVFCLKKKKKKTHNHTNNNHSIKYTK